MAKKKSPTKRKYKNIAAWINAQPKAERPKLKAALVQLRKLFSSRQDEDLRWWHRVGRQVRLLQPTGDRRYGANVVELLADHLQPGREGRDKRMPNLLYRNRDFAEKYTWREAQKLDRERRAGHLTSLHMIALVSLEDEGLRKRLLEKCLKENWSGQRLRREIQNKVGRKRSAGGLSPSPPETTSPGVALRDLSVLARRWMTCHEVWFAGRSAVLRSIPVQDRDEAMLDELGRAADGLIEVAGVVDKELERLERLARDVENTLEQREASSAGQRSQGKK